MTILLSFIPDIQSFGNLTDSTFNIYLEYDNFNCCHLNPSHQFFLDYCNSLLTGDIISTLAPSSLLSRADKMIPLT